MADLCKELDKGGFVFENCRRYENNSFNGHCITNIFNCMVFQF